MLPTETNKSTNFSRMDSSLIIGLDKWSFEKNIEEPFFWMSEQFINSKSLGFLSISVKLKKNFPATLIINLDDVNTITEEMFHLKKKVFFASEWHKNAAQVAVFASDIILFSGNNLEIIKENWGMEGFK